MTGRPPFRRGICACVCVLLCVRMCVPECEQGSMLAFQSHRFSFMLVIVSVCMYIRGETACVVPSPTVLCYRFPVHFDGLKKERKYLRERTAILLIRFQFFPFVVCTHFR